jgi:hypothetical protein
MRVAFWFDEITANIEEPSGKKKPCPTLRFDAPKRWRGFFSTITHTFSKKCMLSCKIISP